MLPLRMPHPMHVVLSSLLLMGCGERGPATAGLSAIVPSAESIPRAGGNESSATSDRPTGTLADAPDRFLHVGNVTIRYRVIGDGAPVLLLHGYTDRAEMWVGLADSLARVHQVIVPDLRGFGKSTVPSRVEDYGKAMMWDLVALLDDLSIPRVHVAGYSMGGLLAAHLALEVPERITAVTLVAGALYVDSTEAHREVAIWADSIQAGRGLTPFFEWILPTFSKQAVADVAEQLQADNAHDALVLSLRSFPQMPVSLPRVRNSRIPATLVIGSDDPLTTLSRRMAREWPNAQYVEVPGANHADIHLAPATLDAVRQAISRSGPATMRP